MKSFIYDRMISIVCILFLLVIEQTRVIVPQSLVGSIVGCNVVSKLIAFEDRVGIVVMSLQSSKMAVAHVFACSIDAIGNGVGHFRAQTAQFLHWNKRATVSFVKR